MKDPLGLPLRWGLREALGQAVLDMLVVPVPLLQALRLLLALPAGGEALPVMLALSQPLALPLTLTLALTLSVTDQVCVGGMDLVPPPLALPPALRDSDAELVEERVTVMLGEAVRVPARPPPALAEGEPLTVLEALMDAVAPRERECASLRVPEDVWEAETHAVLLRVPLPPLPSAVAVPGCTVKVMLALAERVAPPGGARLAVARRVRVVVRVPVRLVEAVEVRESVEHGDGVREGTRDALGAPLPV